MLEEDVETAVAEDVETESVVTESPKKTAPVKTKERQTSKVDRKEVQQEEEKEPEESQDLKWENIQRRKENTALKAQIQKLTESHEAARVDFEAAKKTQETRLVRATLLTSLTKAGCVDSETVLGLLSPQIQFDKNGDVSNDVELVDSLKKNKAYFFTGPATSQTAATPKASTTRGGDVRNMDDNEFAKVLKSMGVKTR